MIGKVLLSNVAGYNYGVKGNYQQTSFRGNEEKLPENKNADREYCHNSCPYYWQSLIDAFSLEDKKIKATRLDAQNMYAEYVSTNERCDAMKAELEEVLHAVSMGKSLINNSIFYKDNLEITPLEDESMAVKQYAEDGSLLREFLIGKEKANGGKKTVVQEFTIYKKDGRFNRYVKDEESWSDVYKRTSSDNSEDVVAVYIGNGRYSETKTFINKEGREQTNSFEMTSDGDKTYYEDVSNKSLIIIGSAGTYASKIYEDKNNIIFAKGYEDQYKDKHFDEELYMNKHKSCNRISEYRKDCQYSLNATFGNRMLFNEDGLAYRYDEECTLCNNKIIDSKRSYESKDGYRWLLVR